MSIRVIQLVAGLVVGVSILSLSGCLDAGEPFDPWKQLEKDQVALDDYIESKGYTDVQRDTLDGNLRYVILEEGDGELIHDDDWLLLDYEGSLLNGTVFDERDSIYLKLANLIPGWRFLLPYNPAGGRMIMLIPSLYGYQNTGAGTVPANSPLIFDVTVHDLLSQFDYEQAGINLYAKNYIEKNMDQGELVLETDSVEGLHYIILQEGNGAVYPTVTDVLNVDYEGRFIDDQVFTGVSQTSLVLEDLIEGWQILMPYVSEGGKILMFIPSEFGYGEQQTNSIAPNSTLIFEVTLNSIAR